MREASIRFICQDLRPYYAVECEGLLELLYSAVEIGQSYPHMSKSDFNSVMPSRSTVQRSIESKIIEVRQFLHNKIHQSVMDSGGFSCTMDLWTDKFRQKSFFAMTAHLNRLSDAQIIHDRFVIYMDEVEEDSKTMEVMNRTIRGILYGYGFNDQQIQENIHFITDRGSQFKALKNIHQ